MKRLRKCLEDPARKCVRMILLTSDAEKVILMLEKNFGGSEKFIEQLKIEARQQKVVKNSSDFLEFSNLVEKLAITVDNIGKRANFSSGTVIKELLKKLPEYLRLQWGQFLVQHNLDDADIYQFATWVRQQNESLKPILIGFRADPARHIPTVPMRQ
jgi:Protein of unknown function (DUF1759)